MKVPAALTDANPYDPRWQEWIERLPRTVESLLRQWDLSPDGDQVWHGNASVVLPVTDRDRPAVLKVGYDGDTEAEQEALALRLWDGNGTVRLLRADPRRRALALERLHRTDLAEVWDLQACQLVAQAYRSLHVPATPQFTTVADRLAPDLGRLERLPRDAPVPRRFVDRAVALGRDLLADSERPVLLHGDLHYGNVLAADRAPWLVIDPKPLAGDRHFEPAPMLINRMAELGGGPWLRDGLRQRFHRLVDVAELDEDRARDWVIVRMIVNAGWSLADAEREHRRLTDDERRWITRCLTVAKAVQD